MLYIDLSQSHQSGISLHRKHLCKQINYRKTSNNVDVSRSRGLTTRKKLWNYIYAATHIRSVSQSHNQAQSHGRAVKRSRKCQRVDSGRPEKETLPTPSWVPVVKEAKALGPEYGSTTWLRRKDQYCSPLSPPSSPPCRSHTYNQL